MKGGWGRVVWMPTFDAENQVRVSKEQRPFVPVSRNGALLPEVKQVLAFLAKHNLALATGHSSPAEVALLVSEAKKAGVSRIVVTHGSLSPVLMSVPQMKSVAASNVWIEFPITRWFHRTAWIRRPMPRPSVLSDRSTRSSRAISARPAMILHPDGMTAFFKVLRANGFTEAEIDRMAKTNPARFLGLSQMVKYDRKDSSGLTRSAGFTPLRITGIQLGVEHAAL